MLVVQVQQALDKQEPLEPGKRAVRVLGEPRKAEDKPEPGKGRRQALDKQGLEEPLAESAQADLLAEPVGLGALAEWEEWADLDSLHLYQRKSRRCMLRFVLGRQP